MITVQIIADDKPKTTFRGLEFYYCYSTDTYDLDIFIKEDRPDLWKLSDEISAADFLILYFTVDEIENLIRFYVETPWDK